MGGKKEATTDTHCFDRELTTERGIDGSGQKKILPKYETFFASMNE